MNNEQKLAEALRQIAQQCEEHPIYLGPNVSTEVLIEEGGDAATITTWAYEAREALASYEASKGEPTAEEALQAAKDATVLGNIESPFNACMHQAHCKKWKAEASKAGDAEPVAQDWQGAEEWMPLAWELCAEECGEEACTELVWEGGPIPEPWGDRWLKYEGEAKRLIALVRKCVPATPAAPAQVPVYRRAVEDDRAFVGGSSHGATAVDLWTAMLEAAPQQPAHVPAHAWTDADADAARLALELECLLTDRDMPTPAVSRWWESAHEALMLHRQRLDAERQQAQEGGNAGI